MFDGLLLVNLHYLGPAKALGTKNHHFTKEPKKLISREHIPPWTNGKIIDSKVPAGRGICDRSHEGNLIPVYTPETQRLEPKNWCFGNFASMVLLFRGVFSGSSQPFVFAGVAPFELSVGVLRNLTHYITI